MKTIIVSKKETIFWKSIDKFKNRNYYICINSKKETKEENMSIKAFRKDMGLTQGDFAEIIGVSKVNYGRKENGTIKFSLNEAYKIAKYFNKPIEVIFYDHEVSKNETK